ncbi:MAG: hypothetical protein H6831_06405 [Planctomycetes bacterium]|nr:hypothetical protein [Planctomycetota bacterium]
MRPSRAQRVLMLALALVPAACGGESAPSPSAGRVAEQGTGTVDWLRDDRTYALLSANCEGRGHFDRDTSEMLPVLVQRLADGQRDVLRHAKHELALAGEDAIEPLGSALAAWNEDRYAVAPICNALGALRLSDAPGAHDLLMRYVTHPAVDVRVAAAKGLDRHARPEDYDLLLDLLGSVDPSVTTTRDVIFAAVAQADPARMQRDLASWMQTGEHTGFWNLGLTLALQHVDERTAGRFMGVDATKLGPTLRPQLLALQASGGDPLILAELRHALLEGGIAERSAALLTLSAIGREEWAAEVLAAPHFPAERSRAAAILGPIAERPVARDALRVALNDQNDDVRIASLTALLAAGDALAADRALALLSGSLAEIELASLALRDAWSANPGLADRARDVLLERIELDRADFDRIKPRLQALGLVPGRASAEALMAIETGHEGRVVGGLPLHRWLARSAGNAGPKARAYLAELWGTEPDEARRMDLLEAAGGAQDDTARGFLVGLVEGERATEVERLVSAQWLVQLGPAREVAPLLKRAALRLAGDETRRAFECLLWTWYG